MEIEYTEAYPNEMPNFAILPTTNLPNAYYTQEFSNIFKELSQELLETNSGFLYNIILEFEDKLDLINKDTSKFQRYRSSEDQANNKDNKKIKFKKPSNELSDEKD